VPATPGETPRAGQLCFAASSRGASVRSALSIRRPASIGHPRESPPSCRVVEHLGDLLRVRHSPLERGDGSAAPRSLHRYLRDLVQWQPHLHLLSTDARFDETGVFHPLDQWKGQAVRRLVREQLLARPVERRAISQLLVTTFMSWTHPRFSAHVGKPIPSGDARAMEDMARYLVRDPLPRRLVYADGQQAVIYRAVKPKSRLGQNFVAMDPLER